VDHILNKHTESYSFLFLDTPEKVRSWLKDSPDNFNEDEAFKVLRSRFSKKNSDFYLKNDIIRNPEVGKIFMLLKPEMQIVGVAAYKERKEEKNNLMELLYFCSKLSGIALGIRFMSIIINWA
jgi:hypothetical protein